MALPLMTHLCEFARKIAIGEIEIYNEASIQYELAIFLRRNLDDIWKIQLERNIGYFGLDKKQCLKKEMDIVIFTSSKQEKHCIEIKYPTHARHAWKIFNACKDVRFLEQLIGSGFGTSYFVMFADDPRFYNDKGDDSIYRMFRKNKMIKGEVIEPTGYKKQALHFSREYNIDWYTVKNNLKYFIIEVQP